MQFYIGDDDCLGDDSPCRVIYISEYAKDDSRLFSKNPFEENYKDRTPFMNEGKMTFVPKTMFICTECQEFQEKFWKKVSDEVWDALTDVCYPEGSLVGGYPLFVHQAPEYYDSGEFDTLLLQLDCDDECGIMFGDAGNCYFLISKKDLKNKNFDNVQYGWQCC